MFGKEEVATEVKQEEAKAFTAKDMLDFAKTFAAELKKPSEEDQAKKDAERNRLLENQQNSIAEAKSAERQKQANEAACSHMKPHPYQGKTRIVAPLHSDGLHHPICLNCRKEFPPFPSGNTTIPPGMTLSDYDGQITPAIIEMWGKRHQESKLVGV